MSRPRWCPLPNSDLVAPMGVASLSSVQRLYYIGHKEGGRGRVRISQGEFFKGRGSTRG